MLLRFPETPTGSELSSPRQWDHKNPKDVTRDTARNLGAGRGKLATLKADARHWSHRNQGSAVAYIYGSNAHAAVEAALIEARRRVRMNEGKER